MNYRKVLDIRDLDYWSQIIRSLVMEETLAENDIVKKL